MAEQRQTGTAQSGETPGGEQQGAQGSQGEPQADDTAGLKSALEKERERAKAAEKTAKENADAAKRLQEIEEASKSDLDKATGRADKAEAKAADLEGEVARLTVAIAKGLNADQLEFLHGSSQEELEARADKLLAMAGAGEQVTTPGPRPDLSQGSSGNGDKPLNGDPLLRDLNQKLGIR